MKLWRWFCNLGSKQRSWRDEAVHPVFVPKQASEEVSQSGVDMVCTRVCSQGGCQCGSSVRGLHCVWSYYRIEQ